MARHNYSINTLQARTLKKAIEEMAFTPENVNMVAMEKVVELTEKFPSVFSANDINSFLAFLISECMKKLYSENVLSLSDYIKFYATHKQEMAVNSKDFGAFGDLFELLVRIIIIGNLNLVRSTALSVAQFGKSDVISKKYGVIEIGHNGKTFTEGTCFDYMEGNYSTVIYGMFSDIDKNLIYSLCMEGNIQQAITEIKKRTAIWTNKYQFQYDINHLGKNGKEIKALTIKSGNVQLQFTPGMYFNFLENIENGVYETL